jgi:hypothetical protein
MLSNLANLTYFALRLSFDFGIAMNEEEYDIVRHFLGNS